MNDTRQRTAGGVIPLIAACITMIASPCAPAQTSAVIDVSEPRPLAVALDKLEPLVRAAVNYEDVPYQNPADMQEVSTAQQRAESPGYSLMVPRNGHVSATLVIGATNSEADILYQVNSLIASYGSGGMPGDFTVEQANGMLYVIPTKVQAVNGSWRAVQSPMKAAITIPYAERPVIDTLVLIFEAVSGSSGVNIAVGSVPFWPKQTVAFGATDEPARDALARFLANAANTPMSYRLLFDPKMGYMVNFNRIPGPVTAAPALTPAPPVSPGGTNPFFTKTKP